MLSYSDSQVSQGSVLQSCVWWLSSPAHAVPPHSGSCLMPLVRPCLPPPHVAEHGDHTLHSAHSQFFGGGGVGGGGVGGGAGVVTGG